MENLRAAAGALLMLTTTFTMQSLPLVYSKSTLYKILPLVMFWVPLQCIAEAAWATGNLPEAVMDYAVILFPMIAGNALGWAVGLRFRKILDAERAAEGTDGADDA